MQGKFTFRKDDFGNGSSSVLICVKIGSGIGVLALIATLGRSVPSNWTSAFLSPRTGELRVPSERNGLSPVVDLPGTENQRSRPTREIALKAGH